ncbi:DNA replication/repair protein RecF [Asaia prunellae]|uniref:DNA replication/repair protein RecF n=1 Tax=Asaia prunellae TaxID=610245 RepID=UPI00046F828B|nr:DNA replication/repair protein RecF [Asaia prunellae]
MRIDRLVLTDFRNYGRLVLAPENRLVVLTGENGAGKTNLLEALSLLAPGRGLRAASNAQIQRDDGGPWGVMARLSQGADQPVELATGADPANPSRRIFRLDGDLIRHQGRIAPYFSAIWLTPQMDRLFSEAASGRRRFLDRLVLALDPNHARESAAQERALTQRNRLLATQPDQTIWLDGLEDSIARHAVALTASRMALVDAMNRGPARDDTSFPVARLRLVCDISENLVDQPAVAVEDRLRHALRAARREDAMRGITSFGAHKADLLLEDAVTGRPASCSSSGQQKAMLVHVVLNHALLTSGKAGRAPLVLLDEPLNHLDAARRDALLACLRERDMSVFMTGTDREAFHILRDDADFREITLGRM